MIMSLRKLFENHVKDLYSAERQLVRALPNMAKRANSRQLRAAFASHLKETRAQVERLEDIAKSIGVTPGGKHCKGMEGLIEEATEILRENGENAVIDAGLIAAAQKVEHYEISAYGTARAMAAQLDLTKVAELIQQSLDEEGDAYHTLTEISEEGLLLAAASLSLDERGEHIESRSAPKSKSRHRAFAKLS